MNIGFIGAGKVGCSFGHYLKQQGFSIVGYHSRTRESSFYAANLTRSSPLNFGELIKKSNYIFITTPDDQIGDVWNKMVDFDLSNKKIFHMSGCLSSAIFTNCKDKGALCYSLHPLFSFADKESSDLEKVVFSIEGDNIEKVEEFLHKANIKYFVMNKEDKPLYHASAVFVSNYVVALAKIGQNLLLQCGLDKDLSTDGILPLMESALSNISQKGINDSLTGPIVRGDTSTIKLHMENLPKYKEVYEELGLVALEIVEEKGNLSNEKIEEIYKILRSDSNEEDCGNI